MDCVRPIGKSTVISLLNISIDHTTYPLFKLEVAQVIHEIGKDLSGSTYESQRLIVGGSALLAIYEMIAPHVEELQQAEKDRGAALA